MRDIDVDAWNQAYYRAREICKLDFHAELKTTNPAIKAVVNTFVENTHQVFRIPHFMLGFFMAGKQSQIAESMALIALTGRPFHAGDDPEDIYVKVKEARENILFRHVMPDGSLPPVSITIGSPTEAIECSELMRSELFAELLMSMHVVAAWTVFEALFGDLWEAALNAHPRNLADLTGPRIAKRKTRYGKTNQEPSADASDNMSIQINLLQLHDFDLREKMGTLLRDKFSFITLDGIREAYSRAFSSKNFKNINQALDDENLEKVCLLRNLIVHKAGICDHEYLKKAKHLIREDHASSLPKLDLGQKLELNGRMIHNILPHALRCCVDLIRSVDAWLSVP